MSHRLSVELVFNQNDVDDFRGKHLLQEVVRPFSELSSSFERVRLLNNVLKV